MHTAIHKFREQRAASRLGREIKNKVHLWSGCMKEEKERFLSAHLLLVKSQFRKRVGK